MLKNHFEPISQFVLPKNFVHKVILACHDDNGHQGMERTLGLLQERFFWPKIVEDVWTHIHTCDRCIRFKQPQEISEIHWNWCIWIFSHWEEKLMIVKVLMF